MFFNIFIYLFYDTVHSNIILDTRPSNIFFKFSTIGTMHLAGQNSHKAELVDASLSQELRHMK